MLRKAGRVYDWERESAMRQLMDSEYATRLGMTAAVRAMTRLRAAAIAAYRSGRSPRGAVHDGFEQLKPLLVQAMVYTRLKGLDRSEQLRAQQSSGDLTVAAALSPAYVRGQRFLRRRLQVTDGQLAAMEAQATVHVARVVGEAEVAIQRRLQTAVAEIHRDGLHVREGVKRLQDEFAAAQITPRNRGTLEAIFRTQTQLAYSAGRAEYEQDPDIDAILWGYKYVTVGDDRVRDSHIGLDGVTLPKDDPWWSTNRPPNGYNCRCQVIPIYRARGVVPAPADAVVDGKRVTQGADPGFAFDPGTLLPATGVGSARN